MDGRVTLTEGACQMTLIDKLKHKQAAVWELPAWGEVLRQQWESQFAADLSRADKTAIGMNQYLWHAFSFNRLPCLQRERAIQAFHHQSEKNCYVFFQHSDDALLLEGAGDIAAEDFSQEGDVYVVDREFRWTFVKTHETEWCGPYFLAASEAMEGEQWQERSEMRLSMPG